MGAVLAAAALVAGMDFGADFAAGAVALEDAEDLLATVLAAGALAATAFTAAAFLGSGLAAAFDLGCFAVSFGMTFLGIKLMSDAVPERHLPDRWKSGKTTYYMLRITCLTWFFALRLAGQQFLQLLGADAAAAVFFVDLAAEVFFPQAIEGIDEHGLKLALIRFVLGQ